jgi:hypothetical protein
LGGRRGASLAGARRRGELSAFEERRHRRRGVAARQPIGAATRDARLAQAVEIAQQNPPLGRDAGFAHEIVEMLLHRQRQE